jgi:hypothetical protein
LQVDKQLQQQVLTALLGQEALENAIGVFHMAVDKELAQMAAYKAMGMDPRDIQKFGWLQMLGRGDPNVNITQTQGPSTSPAQPPPSSPSFVGVPVVNANGTWKKLLAAGLLGAGLMGGGAAMTQWMNRPAVVPVVPASPGTQQGWRMRVDWLDEHGKPKTIVSPIQPIDPGKE